MSWRMAAAAWAVAVLFQGFVLVRALLTSKVVHRRWDFPDRLGQPVLELGITLRVRPCPLQEKCNCSYAKPRAGPWVRSRSISRRGSQGL